VAVRRQLLETTLTLEQMYVSSGPSRSGNARSSGQAPLSCTTFPMTGLLLVTPRESSIRAVGLHSSQRSRSSRRMSTEQPRRAAPIRVLMVSPSARHPGGITRAIDTWMASGLGNQVEVDFLPMSAMDSPRLLQAAQAAWAMCRMTVRVLTKRRRPNVVHLHVSSGGSLYRKYVASCISALVGLPTLVHIHSGGLEDWLNTRRIHHAVARRLVRQSSAVIVLAEHWRSFAERLGAQGIHVIPHTLSPEAIARLRPRTRKDHNGSDRCTILYYGRWSPAKGLDVLGDATARLTSEEQKRILIKVFGNGDKRWAEECFKHLPIESVSIQGWLSDDAKVRELESASAVLIPSRHEAFGAALLEVMAAGAPLIASDAGAIPEIVAQYPLARVTSAGSSAELHNALTALINNDWPCKTIDATYCRLPARFASDVVLAQLANVYEAIASEDA
jgi:glycosyltransferase involved in cell wall biosynthesis